MLKNFSFPQPNFAATSILIPVTIKQMTTQQPTPQREIRAVFDETTITVYQAYNVHIARSAVEHQTFVSPTFKVSRMTWIKPSFLWMMYRSGWAGKENQEAVLAIKIKRTGFEEALQNACISHFDPALHDNYENWKTMLKNAPVRVQWDPEKNIHLQELPYRSIQIGLSGPAVTSYISEWIVSVEDITESCKHIHALVLAGKTEEAISLIPQEAVYPLPEHIRPRIQVS